MLKVKNVRDVHDPAMAKDYDVFSPLGLGWSEYQLSWPCPGPWYQAQLCDPEQVHGLSKFHCLHLQH